MVFHQDLLSQSPGLGQRVRRGHSRSAKELWMRLGNRTWTNGGKGGHMRRLTQFPGRSGQ